MNKIANIKQRVQGLSGNRQKMLGFGVFVGLFVILSLCLTVTGLIAYSSYSNRDQTEELRGKIQHLENQLQDLESKNQALKSEKKSLEMEIKRNSGLVKSFSAYRDLVLQLSKREGRVCAANLKVQHKISKISYTLPKEVDCVSSYYGIDGNNEEYEVTVSNLGDQNIYIGSGFFEMAEFRGISMNSHNSGIKEEQTYTNKSGKQFRVLLVEIITSDRRYYQIDLGGTAKKRIFAMNYSFNKGDAQKALKVAKQILDTVKF